MLTITPTTAQNLTAARRAALQAAFEDLQKLLTLAHESAEVRADCGGWPAEHHAETSAELKEAAEQAKYLSILFK